MKLAYVLLFAMVFWGDTVLREVNRTGMRQKGIAVGSSAFTQEHVEQLARTELAAKPHVNFIELYVYGEKGGAPLPKPTPETYEHWRGLYGSLSQASNEIAEMVSIGANAILRMRDASGAIHRHLLAGKDPLQMEVEGDRFEILYFAFSTPGPYILQRADVYIRTDATLKMAAGPELLRQLQVLFPDLEVTIFVRNDPWFIYEATYPFVNPFVESQPPPTPEEYRKGRTLTCRRISGSPTCRIE